MVPTYVVPTTVDDRGIAMASSVHKTGRGIEDSLSQGCSTNFDNR